MGINQLTHVTRSKQKVRSSYNQMSRWYDLFAGTSERKFMNLGITELNPQPGEKILEIGCGTGHGLLSIARSVSNSGSFIGLDLSEGMLSQAKILLRKSNLSNSIHLQLGDGCHLPYSSDIFSAVFLSFTLELFDNPEIPLVLVECGRVLKENGRLAIVCLKKQETTPVRIYEWFHENWPSLVDCHPISVQSFLLQAGFQSTQSSIKNMWGLPVEIAIAVPWKLKRNKMKHELSTSAQKIQDHLASLGYSNQVIEFQETTRTSSDAAERVGCTVGQIVKSLIFKGHNSGKAVLVLTSGANRVDVKIISNLIGEIIDRANPEFVRSVTGFAIGGIPPIGHVVKVETFIDEDLLNYETLWAAAGTPNAVFELRSQDLQKMTSGKVVQIKEM